MGGSCPRTQFLSTWEKLFENLKSIICWILLSFLLLSPGCFMMKCSVSRSEGTCRTSDMAEDLQPIIPKSCQEWLQKSKSAKWPYPHSLWIQAPVAIWTPSVLPDPKPQDGSGWKVHTVGHLLKQGHPRAGLYPEGSWISPLRETPPPLWEIYSRAWSPAQSRSCPSVVHRLGANRERGSVTQPCRINFWVLLGSGQ